MTTFDDRDKAFENKFAHDEVLKFKAEARRNRKLAVWAAGQMGLLGAQVDDYVVVLRKADLVEAGSEDVFRKLAADFKAKSVGVSEADIRAAMSRFMAEAVAEVQAGG